MVNRKQFERLIAKVRRLDIVYEPWLVHSRTELPVLCRTDAGDRQMHIGDEWGGEFSCARFVLRMPAFFEKVWLESDNGGVESLVTVGGIPCGMFDYVHDSDDPASRVHRYLLLENVAAGTEIVIEAYASHTIAGTQPYSQPHTFALRTVEKTRVYRGTFLVTMREDLRLFFDNLKIFNELFDCCPEEDWLKYAQYPVYEELFGVLSMLQSEPTPQSIGAANEIFDRFFRTLSPNGHRPYIGLVGHSHLDTAWLWTVEETRRKAVRTAANAVTLLKRHPEYRFIMSSVLYYDWFRKDQPALFEEIAALVRAGRFEPNGATWVECDCNLTGAEALVRQFVKGKLFLREHFGYEADTFWLPDTFGYSAALPQIMQKCGVKYFLTTKLDWNDTNRFPYDSFVWQGMDGSRVIAHFNTIQSDADPAALARRIGNKKQKYLNDRMLVAYGYGDGGGGPSEEMVTRALRTQAVFPWARVEHTTVSAFMQQLEGQKLPTWYGELYLELHRGTLTMHHAIKRLNRKLEIALRDTEYLSVAAGKREWKEVTDACYETLMLNQFHDILPGTAIGEVNALALSQNAQALERLRSLREVEGERHYYNTLSFAREETLESGEGQRYSDIDGREHCISRWKFPAFGKGTPAAAPAGKVTWKDGVVETPCLRAAFQDGGLTSLVYGGREYAAGLLNEIRVSECVPYQWDNWDIDADYVLKEHTLRAASSRVVSCGNCELRIRSVYPFGEGNELVIDTVFSPFEARVDFECRLDLCDKHVLVRTCFHTNLFAPTVRNSTQFGYIEHPTYRNTSQSQAQFEVCNHKWSDLSENDYGLALLNDGKYGCACEGGTLSLTLAKTATHPDPSGGTGRMYFRYALVLHRAGFGAEQVVQPAERLNIPPVFTALAPVSPLVSVSSPNIICETVKFAERGEGIVLRLYECTRTYTQAVLVFSERYHVFECNMLEDTQTDLGCGKEIAVAFSPFEIKTIRLMADETS